ncbi:MAG: flagellar basal body P-ring protein FlgI [Deltaproteobacteria bacterium]|nr:flagellar basal body P-ring protein FlgI [Deltaproteobacteria bacterium]MBW1737244.1 flagellar basal body P-ring protein FlgI [Deltaproteobacteria bacterium]MBW1908142.1 flagellar basal body P-ring protein FlgI [Deltaproteobacteria bacterium]MBW2032221.1 flagellar basal body P-ring protein FlgI [Deltaproteobacteria bacterium]MBW2113795.1 flagellar basal body P-ring protein FlgI [Deltaproteobacteria bacterium]
MRFKILTRFGLILAILILFTANAHAVRIKDIADIEGVRPNQLVGYGLVVGLDGTGDGQNSKFTIQSMASMLEKMGITVRSEDIKVDNVAAVMLTADLPPFARVGSRLDVLVSSIGDAENLQGGTLLFSPLKAADGQVYAVAQGPVSTGGFSAGGAAGGKVQKNFPTVGRVVGGALVEKKIPSFFDKKDTLSLTLHNPDFTTASRVAGAINTALNDSLAHNPDAGTVKVRVPGKYSGNIVELVALIEGLGVKPDAVSKVVVNERTGTVIMGENVRISTVAIAHGNISIQIKESQNVSQPLPFSQGQTTAVPETDISIAEGKSPIFLVESGVSIAKVVRALNALGVTPRDLIAILQAIKAAGALQAKLEII